jgi:hypothetical protein
VSRRYDLRSFTNDLSSISIYIKTQTSRTLITNKYLDDQSFDLFALNLICAVAIFMSRSYDLDKKCRADAIYTVAIMTIDTLIKINYKQISGPTALKCLPIRIRHHFSHEQCKNVYSSKKNHKFLKERQ